MAGKRLTVIGGGVMGRRFAPARFVAAGGEGLRGVSSGGSPSAEICAPAWQDGGEPGAGGALS
jgi:hypothetical protein